jgi:hypothetical protein
MSASNLKTVALVAIATCLTAACHSPRTRAARAAAPIEPVENEPPARILVDPPLAEALSRGRVVIQYRTENLHIVPVFGAAAVAVSPRIGHLHVTLDGAAWVWADASGEPVVLSGLAPGPHEVKLEIRTANHAPLGQAAVRFTVPAVKGHEHAAPAGPAAPIGNGPPATLVVDPPAAEPLARGVAFIRYRAENLHIVPVFGEAALAIAPAVGHVHLTVDDATWHWADASGNPIIVSGLPPGPHRIRIDLVNAAHQPIDHADVAFEVTTAALAHAGHH